MEKRLLCSIIESIYIIYFYNYFKTTIRFHHPFEKILTNHDFLKHPISSSRYESKICKLGNIAGFLLPIWLIGRNFIELTHKKSINFLIMYSFALVSLLLNLNAFVYFLPLFLFEIKFCDLFTKPSSKSE